MRVAFFRQTDFRDFHRGKRKPHKLAHIQLDSITRMFRVTGMEISLERAEALLTALAEGIRQCQLANGSRRPNLLDWLDDQERRDLVKQSDHE